jgi:hypothetical protein
MQRIKKFNDGEQAGDLSSKVGKCAYKSMGYSMLKEICLAGLWSGDESKFL